MSEPYDSSWDIISSERGTLPGNEEVYERKFEEWQQRDWPAWLQIHLTFPFTVIRMEDDYRESVIEELRRQPFRLGHTMIAIGVEAEEDPNCGLLLMVTEGRRKGDVPLADVEVTPGEDANFWPVREYAVWFANSR
jgi:hypothetical protein